MDRPKIKQWKRPLHIRDYRKGPAYYAGHLVDRNAGWRTFKPILSTDKCIACHRCFLFCPDGTIIREEKGISFDYDFCKGCGICGNVCPVSAITMKKESR